MLQQELLKEIIQILNKNNIPYMLTGSVVSSFQGEPRLTHDIDIIIHVEKKDYLKIIGSFPKNNYYFDEKTISDAIKSKGQFNIISRDEGSKIDFWLLTESGFDKSRFSRKVKENFLDFEIEISSPEDTILEKLYWSKISGVSKKQMIDALRVFEVQYQRLDLKYLKFWAEKLEVQKELEEIEKVAEVL